MIRQPEQKAHRQLRKRMSRQPEQKAHRQLRKRMIRQPEQRTHRPLRKRVSRPMRKTHRKLWSSRMRTHNCMVQQQHQILAGMATQ